ncbi:MAG: DUF4914 family protein [Candidatus Omnitrophota bacterium]|nr:DUF4914 family protein [Candidatus Omnitrophota bacterium]
MTEEKRKSAAPKPWLEWKIPDKVKEVLNSSPQVTVLKEREQILSLATGGDNDFFEVAYEVEGRGRFVEATVARCKNGLAVNYTEQYMRRRDPDCMVIGDEEETDKVHFRELFGGPFAQVRLQTFEWLQKQRLAVLPIMVGGRETGYHGLLIAPDNAGFFVGGLADLQGILAPEEMLNGFQPRAIIYLAPTFRHTHFQGKQIVVHNRIDNLHEIFSYNLYPGPSAKKGIYGVLLQIGEREKWLTLHSSTVRVVTPYENITTILHEGASGGGKSEMLEYPHRQPDGRLLVGTNTLTGEKVYIELHRGCSLMPVTDDMALSLPKFQEDTSEKVIVTDAEQAWFVRLNHITHYNTDPHLESLSIHPREPLIFLNIDGVPKATCLIWEHTKDENGKPCPNPRCILPRRLVPDIVDGPVEVDFRSFGIRTPACSKEEPTYGILGILHILPPALAWLWRLVSPRGDTNPSITDTLGLTSEGVGSYWPFATGKFVNHANLLLRQIVDTPQTRYLLFPNQHVGVWKVGFMPQWISREYIARRGAAKFKSSQLLPARCVLLGYTTTIMEIEGMRIPEWFIQVDKQPAVGAEGYDAGAKILYEFFQRELPKFLTPEIDPLGRKIISCCLDNGKMEDYLNFIPMTL